MRVAHSNHTQGYNLPPHQSLNVKDMKKLIVLIAAFGIVTAQDIEPQKQYEKNQTIKIPTLGINLKFDFVSFGDPLNYELNSRGIKIGFQPGSTLEQVKAGIEAVMQNKGMTPKGGVKIRGDTLAARYQDKIGNYWRLVYRRGAQGQGIMFSESDIYATSEANEGKFLLYLASKVKFFAPQNTKLLGAWKAKLEQKWVFFSDNMAGTDVLRFCNNGTASFRGSNGFPRLSVLQDFEANNKDKAIKSKWKIYPVNTKLAFLILEYAKNDIRTLQLQLDEFPPAIRTSSGLYQFNTPEKLVERKLEIPECS